MMNKGIVWGTLIWIILALTFAAVLGLWIAEYADRGGEAYEVQACRFSVKKATEFRVAGQKLSKINCPRKHIHFEDETYQEINSRIARSLYNAVRISGEGEDDWTNSPWVAQKAGRLCIILDEFTFDDRYRDTKVYPRNSLDGYMRKSRVSRERKTYYEYFREVEDRQVANDRKLKIFWVNRYEGEDREIDPSHPWVLFFARYSEPYMIKTLREAGIDLTAKLTLGDIFYAIYWPSLKTASIIVDVSNPNMSSKEFMNMAYTSSQKPEYGGEEGFATTPAAFGALSHIYLAPIENVEICDVVMN